MAPDRAWDAVARCQANAVGELFFEKNSTNQSFFPEEARREWSGTSIMADHARGTQIRHLHSDALERRDTTQRDGVSEEVDATRNGETA